MLADLCLPLDDLEPALHRERVAALLAKGYDAVASVHTATGRLSEADRCTLAPVPAASLASATPDAKRALLLRSGPAATAAVAPGVGSGAGGGGGGADGGLPPCHLRQLSRLHFVAADPVQAAQLAAAADVVRSYDIVSIAPKSERVLFQACSSLDVDVIALELASRSALKLRAPAVKAALKRGIHFEICYAPGLREPTARRNLFCAAQALVRATRGRNILLSSSARSAFEVRSPLEVAAMATLFGLTRQQAQDALCLAPRAVLAHAAARLAGRGAAPVAVAAPAPGGAGDAGAAATPGLGEDAGTPGPEPGDGDVEMGDTEAKPQPPAQGRPQRPQRQAAAAAAAASPAAGQAAAGAGGSRKRRGAGS
ncbi:hypothetical protein HYH03_015741 [Edaphochlamys debaryana]|uniref:Uncharacterized protein n=1 Tax=Edaphochlamys debaryana TaxID=47281 RepID=A0A835XLF0_9CHLO|nr:hypothetical protein HYH03_015741 [Edaphochlamys debaryana]|eukprot:KAG2485580.1 hypothetical protein HYH03_015741 [Edaphochlamys debaryana]